MLFRDAEFEVYNRYIELEDLDRRTISLSGERITYEYQ